MAGGTARSVSMDSNHDMHDSELDLDEVESQAGLSKRKGKGKVTKESDRKAQNRIAQREFRQRKQAYIKELEAKVKLQEMGRDEQIERLTDAVRVLLEDNDNLRQLLAGLGGYIGEGLGGVLPKLRTTLPDFESLISKSRLDNATGALRLDELGITSNRSNHPQSAFTSTNLPPPLLPTSYPIPSSYPSGSTYPPPSLPISQPPSQASRTSSGPASYPSTSLPLPPPTSNSRYTSPAPISSTSTSRPIPPPLLTAPPGDCCPLTDSESNREGEGFETAEQNSFTNWFLGQVHEGNHDAAEEGLWQNRGVPQTNVMQAMQLISYHMRSKREHPDYNLPPSLKATPTQTLVPHSPIFDGIIFPSLRDRLILLKDQYSLSELTRDLTAALRIHGNDLLSAENWELSLEFLRKYWFVIDESVLEISNKWRKERGESELNMKSIVPDMDD